MKERRRQGKGDAVFIIAFRNIWIILVTRVTRVIRFIEIIWVIRLFMVNASPDSLELVCAAPSRCTSSARTNTIPL